ncbi:MAG: Unknown protein [uncultured Campylobacterales bacterium]|uniref:Uncharacterized protein n=1 Tax=uncultured Campylobacterales bacterium TaxID=352960 RepID=A0A6S6SSN2_9BACT|nr:MAG: Unknown protein [uncultured Campylobacterales bacterium]
MKQEGMPRQKFFQQEIKKFKYDKLVFLWVTTFDEKHNELPSLSEAKMIQVYFSEYGKLPLLNKQA